MLNVTKRIIFIIFIMATIVGLSACINQKDSNMPSLQAQIDEADNDFDLTLYDPEEQWLPYTVSMPAVAQGWLSPYVEAWPENKLAPVQNDPAAPENPDDDITMEYSDEVLEYLPTDFPINLVPIYKFMEISQSGFNEETNGFFFYYSCDAPYKEIISFYQDQFSGHPGFTEEDDLDTHYMLCKVSNWQIRINVCDFFGGDTAYVEIDVEEGE